MPLLHLFDMHFRTNLRLYYLQRNCLRDPHMQCAPRRRGRRHIIRQERMTSRY